MGIGFELGFAHGLCWECSSRQVLMISFYSYRHVVTRHIINFFVANVKKTASDYGISQCTSGCLWQTNKTMNVGNMAHHMAKEA